MSETGFMLMVLVVGGLYYTGRRLRREDSKTGEPLPLISPMAYAALFGAAVFIAFLFH